MKQHPLLFVVVPALLTAALTVAACTTNTVVEGKPTATTPPCDPTLCAPGNMCIPDATGASACRLPCTKHTDCPFNTECMVSGTQNYCVKLTTAVVQKPTGQWGTPCLPEDGLTNNKACDSAGGFACYAKGTTDALAYCTLYDCMTDLDCAGGFYCGIVNSAPNAKTDVRSLGKTRAICLKHEYCSPCAGDLDCPVVDGKASKCIAGDDGALFCAPQCAATANCRLDATCTSGLTTDGTKVCRPRAHTCKGDGSLCSPCRSDADCPKGYCVKGGYSPETFCTVKSAIACVVDKTDPMNPTVKSQCPKITISGTEAGCGTATDSADLPKDQCVGLVPLSDGYDVGCYTRHPE